MRVSGVPGPGAWAYLGLSVLSGESPHPLAKRLSVVRDRTLVIVRKSDEDLEDTSDAAAALSSLFPGTRELVENAAFFGGDERARWASLEKLQRGSRLVFASAESLSAAFPSRDRFGGLRRRLRIGDTIPMNTIIQQLAELGYQRADFVGAPGEFAVRGAVVDFFPLEPLRAVRLLFNESLVESVRSFDPETQAGGAFLDEAVLAPVAPIATGTAGAENGSPAAPVAAVAPAETTLTAWLSGALWLVESGVEPPAAARALSRGSAASEGRWGAAADCVEIGTFADESAAPVEDFGAKSTTRFQGNMDLAARQFQKWRKEGLEILVYSINSGESERVQELLHGKFDLEACRFLIGPLRSGFVLKAPGLAQGRSPLRGPDAPTAGASGLAVVTSSELFDRSYRPAARWQLFGDQPRRRARRADLKPGDYVVHERYGIARYLGTRTVRVEEGEMDCLLLEYSSSDKLYVPMADFRLVQKFIAAEGHRPRLSSLDTRRWEDVKEKVKEGVRDIASELLKVQAARAARPGHAFPPESHIEREFADSFPYEETPDQSRAIAEVLADMTAATPMDRVVVGDVGFGKTEVAMRAAFKCAVGGKQTAVLVPTTILAVQHYRTFSQRFAEYPVKIALLSRFQTPAEQKKALEGLKAKTIDVVIGTHRLLSPDIRFGDLGLLVIDEEHRFGVRHKERLKALKSDVDALSMTATPIPRTLNQSLAGLRGISIIESAPSGRQPIVTWVGPWSKERVKAAVEAELARGGQAYYVSNHVRGLPAKVRELQALLPGARFSMAHGQMSSEAIERAMWDFYNRKSDVLVASSIIESGLDIPTVNTILVEDAQDFGLAQLYQLRGRVGRERRRASCYLFCPEGSEDAVPLSEEAQNRLSALREFGELGSGLRLAMRDLEIRGAGDLLGARQHGFINAVGVEYYSQLLNDQIAELKGRPKAAEIVPAQLDLSIQAFIPENYLPGESERLGFYKRLLAASADGLPGLRREIEDLSGPAPEPVVRLFRLLAVRLHATARGVREAAQRGEVLEVRFRPDAEISQRTIRGWMERYGNRIEFTRSAAGGGAQALGDGVRFPLESPDPLDGLSRFLETLGAGTGVAM